MTPAELRADWERLDAAHEAALDAYVRAYTMVGGPDPSPLIDARFARDDALERLRFLRPRAPG